MAEILISSYTITRKCTNQHTSTNTGTHARTHTHTHTHTHTAEHPFVAARGHMQSPVPSATLRTQQNHRTEDLLNAPMLYTSAMFTVPMDGHHCYY